jgi:hypothetical protein
MSQISKIAEQVLTQIPGGVDAEFDELRELIQRAGDPHSNNPLRRDTIWRAYLLARKFGLCGSSTGRLADEQALHLLARTTL